MTYSIHDERLNIEEILTEKDKWILKPEDSYGSQGIHAGVECNAEEWKEYFYKERNDADSTYLIQEFCVPYQTMNVDLAQGERTFFPVYNLTGLFTYGENSGECIQESQRARSFPHSTAKWHCQHYL